jgi:hypothetical protein
VGGGRDPPQMKVGRSVRRVFRFHWLLFRGLVRPRRLFITGRTGRDRDQAQAGKLAETLGDRFQVYEESNMVAACRSLGT